MKKEELAKIKPGDDVKHKRYGLCLVEKVECPFGNFFGMVVRPKTDEGKNLLAQDCGVPDIPLMEGSLRSLSVAD